MFGTMETVHLSVSTAYAPRKPETISGPVMVVEGSRPSTVADSVVHPGVRIKAVPILFIAKFVIDVVDWIYNILLLRRELVIVSERGRGKRTYTKSIIQACSLQSVEIEGGSVKLGRKPGEGRTQISPVEISDRMGTGRTEPAAQTLRLCRKRGTRGLHQMGRSV